MGGGFHLSTSNDFHPSGALDDPSMEVKGHLLLFAGGVDDNGYGWAIAKSLAAAGAEILVGTWVHVVAAAVSRSGGPPADSGREQERWQRLRRGGSGVEQTGGALPDGSLMEITKVYTLNVVFDNLEDVPR
ncbi:hypothetical protein L1987_48247 [Smallanthus sonchifolius]|uniref:Uncharacterized protein n=1 Tax=Smallanthus sonchifolius TaxID=185202 RepID=A0ACB9FR99_9ASTR|nr:hypothetical protein L1987_48247 [Smallanthus sonchifolius]